MKEFFDLFVVEDKFMLVFELIMISLEIFTIWVKSPTVPKKYRKKRKISDILWDLAEKALYAFVILAFIIMFTMEYTDCVIDVALWYVMIIGALCV